MAVPFILQYLIKQITMNDLKQTECVLLVDDEKINNYLNAQIIQKIRANVVVRCVLNGQEALEYITHSGKYAGNQSHPHPKIIFLDINMPKMNGWEFLNEYSKLPVEIKNDIVITMLTASVNPDDKERACSYHEVSDYINKPVSINTFSTILSKYFNGNSN